MIYKLNIFLLEKEVQQWLDRAIINPWIAKYITVGYAAKGTIYFFIGIIAVKAAFIDNYEALGTYETLIFLSQQPLGKFFVCLLAIALNGYVLRRLFQTVLAPNEIDFWSVKHVLKRFGYILSGLSYASVSYSALNLVLEIDGYKNTIEDLAEGLLERAFGQWLILLTGFVVVAVGLGYLRGAFTGSYISDFQSEVLHHHIEKWAIYTGKIGVAARGVAFVLMGIFLTEATIIGNSKLAGGLQNTLRILATIPLGWLWLSFIGLGMICYGLYMYVVTIYRKYTIG